MADSKKQPDPTFTDLGNGRREADPAFAGLGAGKQGADPAFVDLGSGRREADPEFAGLGSGRRGADSDFAGLGSGRREADSDFVGLGSGQREVDPALAALEGKARVQAMREMSDEIKREQNKASARQEAPVGVPNSLMPGEHDWQDKMIKEGRIPATPSILLPSGGGLDLGDFNPEISPQKRVEFESGLLRAENPLYDAALKEQEKINNQYEAAFKTLSDVNSKVDANNNQVEQNQLQLAELKRQEKQEQEALAKLKEIDEKTAKARDERYTDLQNTATGKTSIDDVKDADQQYNVAADKSRNAALNVLEKEEALKAIQDQVAKLEKEQQNLKKEAETLQSEQKNAQREFAGINEHKKVQEGFVNDEERRARSTSKLPKEQANENVADEKTAKAKSAEVKEGSVTSSDGIPVTSSDGKRVVSGQPVAKDQAPNVPTEADAKAGSRDGARVSPKVAAPADSEASQTNVTNANKEMVTLTLGRFGRKADAHYGADVFADGKYQGSIMENGRMISALRTQAPKHEFAFRVTKEQAEIYQKSLEEQHKDQKSFWGKVKGFFGAGASEAEMQEKALEKAGILKPESAERLQERGGFGEKMAEVGNALQKVPVVGWLANKIGDFANSFNGNRHSDAARLEDRIRYQGQIDAENAMHKNVGEKIFGKQPESQQAQSANKASERGIGETDSHKPVPEAQRLDLQLLSGSQAHGQQVQTQDRSFGTAR